MPSRQSSVALLVGVCFPLAIFLALAIAVWYHGDGFLWDIPILQAIHLTARPHWDITAHILTQFGVYWGVIPVSVLIGLGLLYTQRWRSLAYLATTLLGSTFLNRTAKVLLHRARPQVWDLVTIEPEFAFPSGHAMASFSFVAVLVVLTWGTRWRWVAVGSGTLFVLGVAWTRLYLGVHYPSDILAGWMLTLAWASLAYLLLHPHPTATGSEPVSQQKSPDPVAVDEQQMGPDSQPQVPAESASTH